MVKQKLIMNYRVFKLFFLKNIDYHIVEDFRTEESMFYTSRALFWRKILNWDIPTESDYSNNYFVICDAPYDITDYKSKHRNKIRRSLDHLDIEFTNKRSFLKECQHLYNRSPHKILGFRISLKKLISRPGESKFLILKNKKTGKIEGFCHLTIGEKSVETNIQRFEGNYNPSWGITYYLNRKYVQGERKYIINGYKSNFHGNVFQQDLLKYHGYRKCYVNVIYKTKLPKLIIRLLIKFLPGRSNYLKILNEFK